jgi:VWFA-related protein
LGPRLAVLLSVTCATLAAPGAASAQTFSSRIEAVRVDVLVTDGGRVVEGLDRDDFEVRDSGVVQDVELVSFEHIPLNVVLGFDVSASVSGERLEHLQGAGHTLLRQLTDRDRAALVTFSHLVQLREGLTADLERVDAALAAVRGEGDTSLVDGSYAAMTVTGTDAGRSLLILFSDGLDTASWLSPDAVLESARRADVVVYGVAVRGGRGTEFLEKLTEATGGDVLDVESTRDLSGTFVRILDEFRRRYLLSFTPRGVASTGWHRLEVRVKGRRVNVRARAGYQAASQ